MIKEQILKLIPEKKWVIASTPGYLMLCYGWMHGFIRMKKYLKHAVPEIVLVIREGGLASQIVEEKEMYANVEQLYKDIAGTKIAITRWQSQRDVFFEKWAKLDSPWLPTQPKNELGNVLNQFIEDQIETWAAPLAADMLGIYSETSLLKRFENELPAGEANDLHELFASISQPEEISFVSRERISLLELALLCKEESSLFEKRLLQHQQEFYWVKNTYRRIEVLSSDYFRNSAIAEAVRDEKSIKGEIENLKKSPIKAAADKKELFERYTFSAELKEELQMTPRLGTWLDIRKEFNLRSNHLLYLLLLETSKAVGRSIEEVNCLLPNEINLLIRTGELPSDLTDRTRWLAYVTEQPEKGSLFSGSEARELIYEFEAKIARQEIVSKELRGVVASKGQSANYHGIVRIVHDPQKDNFKEGEILVTSMTRPEFVTLMRKALAIITDEGGIAAHAAIVSRELKIPCVIGTKVATKILQNGDEVDIDISTGIVKIVKKA